MRFEFGNNWLSFLKHISDESISSAKNNICLWLDNEDLSEQRILDIGCGSGIHSFAFWKLGVKEIISFDFDSNSVKATLILWETAGRPDNWKVFQGSVLDDVFLIGLGKFDIVYSWGVLHHTGDLWNSVLNSISFCTHNNSIVWLALYQGVDTYKDDLKLKLKYNNSSFLGKKFIVFKEILKIVKKRRAKGKNFFTWNEKRGRGMDTYHDLIDWLGGYPYEVCSRSNLSKFMYENGCWTLKKYNDEQSCLVAIFHRTNNAVSPVFQSDSY
jgi:2-polyprenyl-3-methyl-5-hydroxy-6-metoxy-1,4-benzoquinol methylase